MVSVGCVTGRWRSGAVGGSAVRCGALRRILIPRKPRAREDWCLRDVRLRPSPVAEARHRHPPAPNSFVILTRTQLLPSTYTLHIYRCNHPRIHTIDKPRRLRGHARGLAQYWLNWSTARRRTRHPCDLRSRHYVSGRSVGEIFERDAASSRPAAAAKRLAVDMPLPATRM